MKELAIPFTVPNLEQVQAELLSAIDHDYKAVKGTHAFSYPIEHMLARCPNFMSWLVPKIKAPVRIFRYYITPPHTSLGVHIDGVNPTSPFGLNIPVAGTKNTYHSYYETTEDNMIPYSVDGYLGHIAVKDESKLKLISDRIEVMRPYVMNNSVLHGVQNESDEYRVMFTIRWRLTQRVLEDVIDTSELMLGHY